MYHSTLSLRVLKKREANLLCEKNKQHGEDPDEIEIDIDKIHTLTHSHTHTLTHSHTHTLTHSHTQTLTHSHAHTLTHSHTHTLTHSHTHTLTHSHTHTLTHARTHRVRSRCSRAGGATRCALSRGTSCRVRTRPSRNPSSSLLLPSLELSDTKVYEP